MPFTAVFEPEGLSQLNKLRTLVSEAIFGAVPLPATKPVRRFSLCRYAICPAAVLDRAARYKAYARMQIREKCLGRKDVSVRRRGVCEVVWISWEFIGL